MKKSLVALLLVFSMCFGIFALVGCRPRGVINQADLSGGYDGSAVTIRFYHTMSATNLQPVLDDAIERFNELYPNITVDHKQVGDYDAVRNQISQELTVGGQPHLAYCYPDHVALYNVAKAVVPLDELIASEIEITRADGTKEVMGLTQAQIDNFIPGFYNEGKAYGDDKMYTLPYSKSTEVLYYNKTFFDAAAKAYTSDLEIDMSTGKEALYPVWELDDKGEIKKDENGNNIQAKNEDGTLKFETRPNPVKGNENYNFSVPTTWDEMEVVCRKIKAIYPNSTPLGYDSEDNWFITMCEQLGSDYTSATKVNGTHYLFDNEANWAFVQKFASWYAEGLVTTKELSGGYTSDLFKKNIGDLQKSFMSIGSSAGATHQTPDKVNGEYPFETAIVPIPQIDVTKPKAISQGPSICLFQQDNEQEVYAAWLFLKFITTDMTTQAEFSEASGYVPVIQSVNDDEDYQDFMANANGYKSGIAATSAKVCLEQGNSYYVSPAFNGSSKAREEVGLLMQTCFSNYETASDKLAMIKEKFDAAIEECEY